MTTAYELYRRAYLRYMGRWIGPSLKHMHLPTGPKDYILQSFEESLNDYTISVENNGDNFVLTFEYNPDNPTLKLAEYLQNIVAPTGFYLIYVDGHDGMLRMTRNNSRSEAKASIRQIYQKCFRHQVFMTIVKI